MRKTFTDAIGRTRHTIHNLRCVRLGTRPGAMFFRSELGWLLGCDDAWLAETAAEYRRSFRTWRLLSGLRSVSPKTDGYARSLDVAEGFAAWALIKHVRPRSVVELGTQYGIYARLWKDALARYVPDHELILIDIRDARRYITDDEALFIRADARDVPPEILSSWRVDLLFNDAHSYSLVMDSVRHGVRSGVRAFAFHDVGRRRPRGPFNPEGADVSLEEKLKEDESDYVRYGTWERHVMAEVFDRRALFTDSVCTESYAIQFFDSLFGFGVAIENSLVPAASRSWTASIRRR